MSNRELAAQDFERAIFKGFWRRVLARLRGESNELLPFHDVRDRLPIGGQHYIGLRQVEVEKIIGSSGRYRDFDRAFLPVQTRTRGRWISIDQAHYEDVILPPVELYKMGEIYFVKDGNHRVSVARERGQVFLDAYVIEIEVPITLTTETSLEDVELRAAYAAFLLKTRLAELRPNANLETHIPGQYGQLLEHIAVHRWYLGEQRGEEVTEDEATSSWYDNVYLPIVEVVRQQNLLRGFPAFAEADLYLWIMQYEASLRQLYRDPAESPEAPVEGIQPAARAEAAQQIVEENPDLPLKKLASAIRRANWVDALILGQERAAFLRRTSIGSLRPEAQIEASQPGAYDRLLEHIAVHRWYLGIQRGSEAPYPEAVASWYDNVYLPLVNIIRQQEILSEFPGRTETDLYLWIIARRELLRQSPEL